MGGIFHLERQDVFIIGLLLIVSVLSGFWLETLQQQQVLTVHDVTFYLPGIALILGAPFIYLARKGLGGDVARDLEVTGAGLLLLGVFWVIFAQYFTAGNPAWLGLSPSFWTVFIMGAVASSFFLIAYGFYLFWKTGGGAY